MYEMICRSEDWPAQPKLYKLSSGDSFIIRDEENVVKIGDKYKDYPAFISQIFYEPKKWWQVWKGRKQLGYIVKWE